MREEYLKLLAELNKLGFTIVEIDGRLYQTTEFIPAAEFSVVHSLTGKDVTNYFALYFNNTDVMFLHQKLEEFQPQTKQFHRDYKFVIHLPKYAR